MTDTVLRLSDHIVLRLSNQDIEGVDLSGQVPDVICAVCAASGIIHTPTGIVAVHCKHAERGGWRIHGQWTIPPRPISAKHFARQLRMVLALAKLQLAYERGSNPTH